MTKDNQRDRENREKEKTRQELAVKKARIKQIEDRLKIIENELTYLASLNGIVFTDLMKTFGVLTFYTTVDRHVINQLLSELHKKLPFSLQALIAGNTVFKFMLSSVLDLSSTTYYADMWNRQFHPAAYIASTIAKDAAVGTQTGIVGGFFVTLGYGGFVIATGGTGLALAPLLTVAGTAFAAIAAVTTVGRGVSRIVAHDKTFSKQDALDGLPMYWANNKEYRCYYDLQKNIDNATAVECMTEYVKKVDQLMSSSIHSILAVTALCSVLYVFVVDPYLRRREATKSARGVVDESKKLYTDLMADALEESSVVEREPLAPQYTLTTYLDKKRKECLAERNRSIKKMLLIFYFMILLSLTPAVGVEITWIFVAMLQTLMESQGGSKFTRARKKKMSRAKLRKRVAITRRRRRKRKTSKHK